MTTVTVKIDDRSKLGKAILDLLVSTSKESDAVKFVDEKSTYNSEFVALVKKSQKQIKEGKYKVVDTENLWESIGL